ncbi:MAG: hypothetical protein H0U89_12090 [Acidimicrobiia bacterium]|nr:hypothetical protein [Acidimicrobiia bacterium]
MAGQCWGVGTGQPGPPVSWSVDTGLAEVGVARVRQEQLDGCFRRALLQGPLGHAERCGLGRSHVERTVQTPLEALPLSFHGPLLVLVSEGLRCLTSAPGLP